MKTINDPHGKSLRIPFPSSSPSELCQFCRGLGDWFASNWTSSAQPCCYTYKHHVSWGALSESAANGCSFCYQLTLEGEERFMGGTIAHKIQHGKSTTFTAEMNTENAKILFRCDRLEWSVLDIFVKPGKSDGCMDWISRQGLIVL